MSRVWFVTGSSRGLGRAFVEVALEAGDRVAATARHPERLQDLVDQFGDAVLPLRLDVTDYDAAARAVAQTVARFGRIDVAINSAGYSELVRAASGHEATNTRRIAQVVRDLAGRDDAPKRILLGAVQCRWRSRRRRNSPPATKPGAKSA